jgi:hypothetical protein
MTLHSNGPCGGGVHAVPLHATATA